jgi:non-canonical purine NTP pyrophosphatase (RdgB/HAM1 family)
LTSGGRGAVDEPLIFVSGNPNKGLEAERILGLPLRRVPLSLPEIQASSVEEVARHKLEAARSRGHDRCIVEDVSLGFEELGNFPGPYVRWLLEAAGGKGLATLAGGLRSRAARAQCCVAYGDGSEVRIFLGEVMGEVLLEPRGERNFGWDAWFLPAGSARTFGEMTAEEKDRLSHRGLAYRKLREFLRGEGTV